MGKADRDNTEKNNDWFKNIYIILTFISCSRKCFPSFDATDIYFIMRSFGVLFDQKTRNIIWKTISNIPDSIFVMGALQLIQSKCRLLCNYLHLNERSQKITEFFCEELPTRSRETITGEGWDLGVSLHHGGAYIRRHHGVEVAESMIQHRKRFRFKSFTDVCKRLDAGHLMAWQWTKGSPFLNGWLSVCKEHTWNNNLLER